MDFVAWFSYQYLYLSQLILLHYCSFHLHACSNPSLRVAYIDEVEEREGGKNQQVYYSVLVKAVDNHDQVNITQFITFLNTPFGIVF